MKLVTASQMREMDRRAITEYGITSLELMERAGLAVFHAARELLPPAGRALVVCGKGNNGGDGFVVARLLHRAGYEVILWIAGRAGDLSGDARVNYERAARAHLDITEALSEPPPLPHVHLIVDALLGTGLTDEVRPHTRAFIDALNDSGLPILSVDLPSGLDSDTGHPRGAAVRATRTVTFGLPKIGLAQYPGMDLAGELLVADIGIPGVLLHDAALTVERANAEAVRRLLPPPDKATHKGARGSVLIVAGSEGYTGAACLASEAAFRIGAGLVTLACPRSLNDLYEAKLTEVITRPVPEPPGARCFGAESVDAVLEAAEKADAVVFGPGLSRNEQTAAFMQGFLPQLKAPTLIDADGLNLLSDAPDTPLPSRAVLTPHPGEMSRLLQADVSMVQADRLATAREATKRYGAIVLLKGPGTVIAHPDGRISLNPTGTPGLGTAGAGDVLSGAIGGLLARGLNPFDAAVAGAYLHGLAGEIAAEEIGEEGMMAGDVTPRLSRALRRVRDLRATDLRSL